LAIHDQELVVRKGFKGSVRKGLRVRVHKVLLALVRKGHRMLGLKVRHPLQDHKDLLILDRKALVALGRKDRQENHWLEILEARLDRKDSKARVVVHKEA
jgi:hypothetical protein